MTAHMQAHEHLFALAQTIAAYDGVTTNLHDNILHVALVTGGRTEQVRCAPRLDDGGRLWLWDSRRQPIALAGEPDAPLRVTRLVREGS